MNERTLENRNKSLLKFLLLQFSNWAINLKYEMVLNLLIKAI